MTVTGPITISDNKINGGTAFQCSAGNLAVGATVNCSATYTVTQADLDAGCVTNVATASGGGVTSPTDSKTVLATQSPALTLTKSPSPTTLHGRRADDHLHVHDPEHGQRDAERPVHGERRPHRQSARHGVLLRLRSDRPRQYHELHGRLLDDFRRRHGPDR